MRVLFIGPLPEPLTGHSLACRILLDELAKQHSVEVVNLSKQDVRTTKRIFEVLRIVEQVWKKRNDCDVIYFTISESYTGNLKDLIIYLACFRRLSRMVIHLHGGAGMREIMLGNNWILHCLNTFFLRRLGAVVVLGNRLVDMFRSSVAREKIHIVPNFAEDYIFTTSDVITRKFKEVMPLRLLFLSNFLPGKGHIELVEAFRLLDETSKNSIEIDFAGDFRSKKDKMDFLCIINGFRQLRYHGPVRGDVKKRLFHDAHIFCLPTYYPYEGQPISILEAYASGCVVVTTDHSGIFDIFSDGVNGYAVTKKSSQSLKSIIEKLIKNPQELHTKALTNFNTALVNYRTDHYNLKLVQIINSLALN